MLAVTVAAAAQQAPKISAIEVVSIRGEAVESAFVMTHVSSREGAEFDPDTVAADVRTLLDSGRFSYVASRVAEIEDGTMRLSFAIENRTLVVGEVKFTGVGFWYSTDKVREKYGLKAGSFIDAQIVAAAEERVKKLFR
ncbi:MAG: hypothetical protein FWG05_01460, partial [Kiritimatiellaeota bacterium]|nr:hypothetical protein [Kiritimatiellota bacterium]